LRSKKLVVHKKIAYAWEHQMTRCLSTTSGFFEQFVDVSRGVSCTQAPVVAGGKRPSTTTTIATTTSLALNKVLTKRGDARRFLRSNVSQNVVDRSAVSNSCKCIMQCAACVHRSWTRTVSLIFFPLPPQRLWGQPGLTSTSFEMSAIARQ